MASTDEIQTAFRGLPVSAVSTKDGFVAVVTWRLENSGISEQDIADHAEQAGGGILQSEPIGLTETRGGRDGSGSSPGSRFFLVPEDWI